MEVGEKGRERNDEREELRYMRREGEIDLEGERGREQ